jgi:hypothetical protein
MLRTIRRFLTATSLLLCILCALFWARSYIKQDLLEHHRRGDARGQTYDDIRGLCSERGSIGGGYVRITHPGVPDFASRWLYASASPPSMWPLKFSCLGFRYWNLTLPASSHHGPVHAVGLEVPWALLLALFALAPATTARRLYRARRKSSPSSAPGTTLATLAAPLGLHAHPA